MCGKKIFLLLPVMLCSLCALRAQSPAEAGGNAPMSRLAEQSRRRADQNLDDSSNQLPPNSNEPEKPLSNPNSMFQDLRTLIDSGMRGLEESNSALTELEQQLGTLKAETQEQRRLLEDSRNLVTSLKRSLAEALASVDVAVDRMTDAEDYALYIDAQNVLLKQQSEKYRKSALSGFLFGGVSFGVGVPLMVEGARTDNRTMALSGAVTAGAGVLIWSAGHFIFQWW